ncbi:MAG: biotin/lipoyl-binding protein [Chloroflexi bacterium]|nr:biotin/lipoyl-binding protein [Chloroflexota bacterium]
MKYIARVDEREFLVDVGNDSTITINGTTFRLDMRSIGDQQIYSLLLSDHSYEVYVNRIDTGYDVHLAGERHEVVVEDEYTRRIHGIGSQTRSPKGDAQLKAPMPGMVVAVKAKEGDLVKSGQGLVILEAMKMENELRAPSAGTIKQIKIAAGQKVDQGQLLMVISAE